MCLLLMTSSNQGIELLESVTKDCWGMAKSVYIPSPIAIFLQEKQSKWSTFKAMFVQEIRFLELS